jgi:soluble lytic murein transglycosylase
VGQLSRRFVHPVLISAAYNAGPVVTLQWTTQLGSLPVDLFVESLPFKETRAYVKQVVADDFMYLSFYG